MIFRTREDVIDVFRQAAAAERLLPAPVRLGYSPNPLASLLPATEARRRLTQDELEAWYIVTDRLYHLIEERRTRRIVWARSNGRGWKKISAEHSICRNTAKKLFDEGINQVFEKVRT